MQQKIKIWLFSLFFALLSAIPLLTNAQTQLSKESFFAQLQEMGITPQNLLTQEKLSRYELTKLLNAVECQDCVHPSEKMRQTYTFDFWKEFTQLPGKDFRDIFYQNTKFRGQEHFYCVAYVGDQNYMRGYPLATSPLCWGNFCGARSVSKGEFYQTLVNLLAQRIAPNYQIPRKEIKSWLGKYENTAYQYRIFDSKERQLINEQKNKTAPAENAEQLHLYLKYCMFNLRQCGFQRFDQVGEGVWPVAQLNILLNEGIITPKDSNQISLPLSPKEALDKLYLVYTLHTQCDFNSDYDCDGIKNHQDNCVETYNPNQWDLDNDGKGDVCDEDIDGDGKKNPIGLVDATGRINYRLQKEQKSDDESPLGLGNQDFYAFIQIQELPQQAPYRIKAQIQSNQKLKNIERDFWDGNSKKLDIAQHSYASAGKYTLRASFQNAEGERKNIFNQLFIGDAQSQRFALGLRNITIEGNQATLQAESLGAIDEFHRANIASSSEKKTAQLQTFSTQLNPEKKNTITLKGYHQGKLVAVATTDFVYSEGRWINVLLQSSPLSKQKQGKSWFQLRLFNLSLRDIVKNERDFGDEVQKSSSQLSIDHIYEEAWAYSVIQKTSLKNGEKLFNIQSFRIQNPQEEKSYAVNIKGNADFQQHFPLHIETFDQQGLIPELTLKLGNQEQFKKENFAGKGEIFKSFLNQGGQSKITLKALIASGIVLESEGFIFLSTATLEGKNFHQDTKKLFAHLKCDLDKDGIPDLYDDDLDGDGIKNLLGLVQFEKEDCSLVVGENVNANLYHQHFGVCSLDNCPLTANADQSDLNANGIWDSCENGSCGDGNIDEGENCLNCPQDVGECTSICGDGVADEGETCKNCPEDVPQCQDLKKCGDGNIDEGENCLNCPQDVGECTSICGDGNADEGETCKNCPEDIPQCQDLKKCGDGNIDEGETCLNCPQDVGECTSICGDGVADEGETCKNCPQDVPQCQDLSKCGDGNIDEGENCLNCPQDIGECTSICGNGNADEGETCKNCPEDVPQCQDLKKCGDRKIDEGEKCDDGILNGKNKKCTLSCQLFDPLLPLCGNGKIDQGETCKTCAKDVQKCFSSCGNGKVEKHLGEECDNGKENGKSSTCSTSCKLIQPSQPLCGNGKIDKWETCKTCAKDVQRCVSACGNGKVEKQLWEECDNGKQNGKSWTCSTSCKLIQPSQPLCGNGKIDQGETCKTCAKDVQKCFSSCGNGKVEKHLGEECDNGKENGKNWTCSTSCKLIQPTQPFCGNGKIDPGETCKTCAKDIQRCISSCGNGKIEKQLWEECDNGKENGKSWTCSRQCKFNNLCGNGKVDPGEDCGNCPQDVKICDKDEDGIPDVIDECPEIPEDKNGIQDEDGCPEITPPCEDKNNCPLINPECKSCPCQYADFSNTLHKNDQVRARLCDLPSKSHYNYSAFEGILKFLGE